MTGTEARAMTDEKLTSEVKGLRAQLFSLRSQTVTEKVEDNSQFRKIRRDIARLMMVQGERLASGKPAGKSAGKTVGKGEAKAPAKAPSKPAAKAPAKVSKGKKS